MEKNESSYWQKIEEFFKKEFNLNPEIHNMLFMIGVRELGYGFQQLDQATKTKVINFASMFILKYVTESDRERVRKNVLKGLTEEENSEEEIYKSAIINYFKEEAII